MESDHNDNRLPDLHYKPDDYNTHNATVEAEWHTTRVGKFGVVICTLPDMWGKIEADHD